MVTTEKCVVYIEDDEEMIKLVQQILIRNGYEVVGVSGGEDAIAVVQQTKPDLILLDLMMPKVNGWEIYRKIKADSQSRAIPVIVVTARYQSEDRITGLEIERVDDYIIKPFIPAQLLESIERVFNKRQTPTS